MGFFANIPTVPIHEGGHNRLVREDGTVDDTSLRKITGKTTLPNDPKMGLNIANVLNSIDAVAKQMAQQNQIHMFKRVDEVTKETGNRFDLKGEPMTAKVLNDMLEAMYIAFDRNGEPILPSFVCGPEAAKNLIARKEAIESDVAEKRRHDDILAKKREEFYDRESNRRLVG